jgi:hypothetical protein
MSFFCPHFDHATDACAKLRCECIPGRPGCVLRGKVTFLVPPEERVRARSRKAKTPRAAPERGDFPGAARPL